jgi:two-component system chemotaxis sensor kinase CheA
MDDLLEQFVLEARDLVQQAFDDLLALERSGYEPGRMDAAFRAVHTLKGSVGLFDMPPFASALHEAESALARLRDAGRVESGTIGAVLDCMTATEEWIEAVARTGTLPDGAQARARALVAALDVRPERPPSAPADSADSAAQAWVAALLEATPQGVAARAMTAVRYVPLPDCFFLGDDPLALVSAVPSLLALRIEPREAWAADYDPFRCNLMVSALSAAPPDAVRDVFRVVRDQVSVQAGPFARAAPAPDDAPAAAGTRLLRIDSGRIDALADLTAELLIANNRLAHLCGQVASAMPGLARTLAANQASVASLVGGLHRAVMDLRLVPLDISLRRLPRLVREIASRQGRIVEFVLEGGETLADKAIVDGLFEPLLHLLRNAVDHGIEPPDARVRAGKPPAGRVAVRAALDEGHVEIVVIDDGAGIDPAVLRRAAIARGLDDAARIAALDDAAALELIFRPGFSTAETVSDVSGRGVGMDAARTSLRALGGDVRLASTPGVGTTAQIRLPQSAALTAIIAAEIEGERFGLPMRDLVAIARVPRADVVPIRAGHAFALDGRTIPLVHLGEALGRKPPCPTIAASADATVAIMASDGSRVGIEVDRLGAPSEILVRPLPGLLAGMAGIRGTALLGDGTVMLVLDVGQLLA